MWASNTDSDENIVNDDNSGENSGLVENLGNNKETAKGVKDPKDELKFKEKSSNLAMANSESRKL